MKARSSYPLTAAVALCLFASCHEKGPVVDLVENTSKITDTTYVTTTPAADDKNILFEEFTGVLCANCPKAKEKIESIAKIYPGRVFSIAYHMQSSSFTQKIEGLSKFDFRTEDATNVHDYLSRPGDAGLPKAGVNRFEYNGYYWLSTGDWSIMTQDILKEEPMANLTVSSSYDAANEEALIKVKIIYLKETTGKQALTVAITENGIIDAQENALTIDTFYQHDHILRDIVTSYHGDVVLDSIEVKEPGRVYEKTIVAKVAPNWKPENCHIVAFVHNNDANSKEILQAAETTLKN